MTSDGHALRRAAISLRRAAKAADALDGDVLAARLLDQAVREASDATAAARTESERYEFRDPLANLGSFDELLAALDEAEGASAAEPEGQS